MTANLNRRKFLKTAAAAAAGVATLPRYVLDAHAASRDRVTIYHSSVADSIHPYNHSSSPIYGNWQHVIEPLIEYDVERKDFIGVLAESWQLQGNKWVF